MQFVKTHMISLICGVAALAFIGAAVLGMTRDDVRKEMQARIGRAGIINSLAANPQNTDTIAAEQRRGELFQKEYQGTVDEANRINKREPVIGGVFPKTDSDSARFDFKQAYTAALRKLPLRLVAGDLPNEAEIDEARQDIADQQAQEQEKGEEGGDKAKGVGERDAAIAQAPVAPPPMPGGFNRGMAAPGGSRMVAPGTRFGVGGPGGGPAAPSGDPKYDPNLRAYVQKAKSIRVYANEKSFHISPIIESTSAPSADAMWYAQASLWVQQDVVEAIAGLNADAAKSVSEGDVYVEHVPVKRVDRIRIWGYRTKTDFVLFPTIGETGNANEVRPSYTGRTSDDQFDVIPFTVTVVMDQRDILKLVDRVGRQNFYQCTHIDYAPAPADVGYMYGTAPVVRVTLDFEGYFSRKAYLELMPPEILAALGVEQKQS